MIFFDYIRFHGVWELLIIHSHKNQGTSGEVFLYNIWTFVIRGPLPPWVLVYMQDLLKHEISFYEFSKMDFLVKLPLDPLLEQLSMAQRGHPLLIYEVQLVKSEWIHSTSSNLVSINIFIEGISTSIGRISSIPYTKENGVALVEVRTEVQYPCSAKGSILCQSL